MQFTFSVIVTTYNRLTELKRCLKSLEDQIYKDFEVIVYDDGSSDGTKEFMEKHSFSLNLTYIHEENWGGPARGRNVGIKKAKGDWICFLDGDDWWYPLRLSHVAEVIPYYDVIYHDLDFWNKNGRRKYVNTNCRSLTIPVFNDLLVNGNTLCNSATSIRRSILAKVDPISEEKDIVAVEDYDLWIRIAKKTERFYYIDKALGAYWSGDDNISTASNLYVDKVKNLVNHYVEDLSYGDKKKAQNILKYIELRNFEQMNVKVSKSYFKLAFKDERILFKFKCLLLAFKAFFREAI